jgi:hypothetical protein
MSKVLTTAAAIIGLSLGPALAANYHDYHAWSQPTVHDAANYHDYNAWSHPTVQVNYNHGHAGTVLFHGHYDAHPARDKRGH